MCRPETGRAPVVRRPSSPSCAPLDAARLQKTKAPAAAPLPIPLQPATDNGGYIYAPSQAQAAVAAVLRNGYMTHKHTAEEGLLSIDLSSRSRPHARWG